MRTTIEIRDEHRAKLLEMAARRGEKGFSSIVSETIELLSGARSKRQKTAIMSIFHFPNCFHRRTGLPAPCERFHAPTGSQSGLHVFALRVGHCFASRTG